MARDLMDFLFSNSTFRLALDYWSYTLYVYTGLVPGRLSVSRSPCMWPAHHPTPRGWESHAGGLTAHTTGPAVQFAHALLHDGIHCMCRCARLAPRRLKLRPMRELTVHLHSGLEGPHARSSRG